MKRKLLKQMLNEWRANVWLVVELIIVILVVQFIFSSLYNIYSGRVESAGVDCSDVYVANLNFLSEGKDGYINYLSEDKEGYVPYDSVHSTENDLEVLVAQLRTNPYVEIVALGNMNSFPYNYSYIGNNLSMENEKGERIIFGGNTRPMSPELIRLFRIHGVDGETSEQLAGKIANGEFIIAPADKEFEETSGAAEAFLGKDVKFGGDTLRRYHVGAIANTMRRNDYEPSWSGNIYMPIQPYDYTHIAFRVKPGMGHKFLESLKESDKHAGNAYFTDLVSIEQMRESIQIDTTQSIRNFIICALFMLLVIFLGFLGTFWFRTQQRVSEIAIRKVNGASNGNIYARFFAEGLIMLAAAVLVTVPFTVWTIVSDTFARLGWLPFRMASNIQGTVMAILILSLLIVAGIYAPARKATAVDAAQALKDM